MKKTKMLKKNYEFKNVFGKGKYFSGENIGAYIKNNNKSYNLLGLAISVKTAKSVKRNKIKRLIRENYKILEDDIKLGKSIVFLWKKDVSYKNANFNSIKKDMELIFNKSGIKKSNEENIN